LIGIDTNVVIRYLVQDDVENIEVAWKALRVFEGKNIDFSDALIGQGNIRDGCKHTVTFDKKAASLPGFQLLG
jgi:predicted nucleic-acid-binding protein